METKGKDVKHTVLEKVDALFEALNVKQPGDWAYQLGFLEGILIAAAEESAEANRAIMTVIDRHLELIKGE